MADTATATAPAPVTTAPATETPAAPAPAASVQGNASLYVGDLHPEVTEATLFEVFSAIGPLTTIRVCRDHVTRRSLGYAYVNFVNHDDAQKALDELNYTAIRGQQCRIMWSQRDPSIRRSNAGNIFIKSLHKDIDNKALLDTFSQFGTILSCKVKQDANGNSLGYGFVHYDTPEAAQEAVAKVDGKILLGQKVFVGPFVSQAERLANLGKNAARFTNVFIKNLPGSFNEEKLEEVFGVFGKITSRKVLRRVHEGVEKCIAFAAFEDTESAQKAVNEMNEKVIEGLTLYVARAQTKAERQTLLRRDYEKRKADMQHSTKGVNLFVKNLDASIDDERLRNIFSEFGTITSAVVMRDDKGVSKGFGFVCYSDQQEATNAQVNLNKRMIDNKPLYVALAQRKEERKQELATAAHMRMQNMRAQMGMFPGLPMQGPNMMYAMQAQARGFPFVRPPPPPGGFMQQRGGQMMMPPPGPYMRMAGQPGQASRGGPSGQPGQSQQRQPRGGSSQRGGRGGPGQRPPQGAAGQQPQAQFRSQARNLGSQSAAMAPATDAQAQLIHPGREPLTLQELAQQPEQQQKNILGERLYPIIESMRGALAGKITGMLLEMDVSELFHLLEDSAALDYKVREAVAVLEEHAKVGTDDKDNA